MNARVEPDSTAGARLRSQQTKHWNAVADGWAAWLDWTARNFRPLTDWTGEAAGWEPGARLLDVACGAGYPALEAAVRVRPDGFVHATDISASMIALASSRATAAGLGNIAFREMDAEQLQFDQESFHAVTNLYGLMFCPDPQRAVGEAHRVLKRGGRFAAVVWDEPAKSPFFFVINRVATPFLSLTASASGDPGPFRLAPAGALEGLLEAGGFAEIRVDSAPMTFELASADEYLRLFADFAWKNRIAALAPQDRARLGRAVVEAAAPYVGDRLRLVATSIRASGRKL